MTHDIILNNFPDPVLFFSQNSDDSIILAKANQSAIRIFGSEFKKLAK